MAEKEVKMGIQQKLMEIQTRLHCPKDMDVKNYNGMTQYNYRNLAGIMEQLKPLLAMFKCNFRLPTEPRVLCELVTPVFEDEVKNGQVIGRHMVAGPRVYQVATAILTDCETGESVSATDSAREPDWRKGMDASQLSGSASSYAGKYACEKLFALDSTKDADALAADAVKEAPAVKEPTAKAKEVDERDPNVCPCGSVRGKEWAEISTDMLHKILDTPKAKVKTLTEKHRDAIIAELVKREQQAAK